MRRIENVWEDCAGTDDGDGDGDGAGAVEFTLRDDECGESVSGTETHDGDGSAEGISSLYLLPSLIPAY